MPERFTTLARSAAFGVFTADRNGAWTFVSPEGRALLDLTEGGDWTQAVESSARADAVDRWRAMVARGDDLTLELVCVGGRRIDLHASALDGREGWVGALTDASARQKIASVEARERGLLAAVPDMIFVVSPAGRFVFYRGPIDDNLAALPEVFLGRTVGEVLPASLAQELLQARDYATATGEVQVVEYELDTPGGRGFFEARVSGLEDGNWVGFVREVTSERQREQALVDALHRARAATKVRTAFLANVGHELRTPLNGVLGMSEVLRGTSLSEEQRGYLDVLAASGRTLRAIIDDLLDITRLQSGQVRLEPQAVDVSALAVELVAAHRPGAEAKGLGLTLHADHCHAMADGVRLRQVVGNVLDNAIKFTGDGEVVVRVEMRGEQVEVCVRDTGPGIPVELHEAIFAAFEQGNSSAARHHGGLGLGLAISRDLVVRMGGTLEVDSVPGKGASFRVRLPGADVAQPPAAMPTRIERLRHLTVLVVEDNAASAAVLKLLLAADGHLVRHADRGILAVEMLAEAPADVVLLDLHMPEMDGFQTYKRLMQTRPGTPVIAVTADAGFTTHRRCLAEGMSAVVQKPYDPDQIRLVMARVAGGRPAAEEG